jgi:hypothetical protein
MPIVAPGPVGYKSVMMGPFLYALFGLVLVLLLLAGPAAMMAGAVLVVVGWRRWRDPDAALARCAACGYPTRGSNADHCPECGAARDAEGTLPPRERGTVPGPLVLGVTCGTLGGLITLLSLLIWLPWVGW